MQDYMFIAAEWDNHGFSLLTPEEHNHLTESRTLIRFDFVSITAESSTKAYAYSLNQTWEAIKAMLDSSHTAIHTN